MKRAGVAAIVVGFIAVFTIVLFNIGSKTVETIAFQDVTMRVNADQSAWKSEQQYVVHNADEAKAAGITTDIDLSKQSLIVVSMGAKSNGGYSLSVTKVERRNGKLRVSVDETSPAAGCVTTQSISYPHQVVQIPATAGDADFEISSYSKSC